MSAKKDKEIDQNVSELLLNEFRELKEKITSLESEVTTLKSQLTTKGSVKRSIDYTQVDGVVGIFDGYEMLTKDGKKYKIPENYAAKSKLVYGDILKMIEKDGKNLFKHIEKVDRTKVDGILTKKEGEWYLLTDRGSHKVSDVAADFQKAQLNSVATAFLPTEKLDAPFATIDEVEGFTQKIADGKETVHVKKPDVKKPSKTATVKPAVNKPTSTKPAPRKPAPSKPTPAESTPVKPVRKETSVKASKPVEVSKPATQPRKAPIKKAPFIRPVVKKAPEKKEPLKTQTTTSKALDDDDLV